MANVAEGQGTLPSVFINYSEKDASYAQRLYLDLKAANLNPWIDKENLLPGQNIKSETERVIKQSDYFIALLSKISVQTKGKVHTQIKTALDVRAEMPGSIFFLPARLDEVDIPYNELYDTVKDLQSVDLFPDWEDGLSKILQAMNVKSEQIKLAIERQRNTSPYNALAASTVPRQTNDIPQLIPSQLITFKGEKQFFVGRQVYIDQIIKDKLSPNGSKVSIVGPGGSGKTQLAFKAIREYLDKEIFDLVIPVYFDEGLITFEKFLLEIAKAFHMKPDDFELNKTIEQRIEIIKKQISSRRHVLFYLDNFETISLIVNNVVNKSAEEETQAMKINDFLNNAIPSSNASMLLTSREKNNNLVDEKTIDLAGLSQDEGIILFKTFVRDSYLKDLSEEKTRNRVEELLKKTGGHPLSIEIIAKNIRSIHELEELSQDLGRLKEDSTQPDERFKTLRACFDYTIDKLSDKLQDLLPKLTLFSSPFPLSAAVEIFDVTENEILDLYDRSLLTIINSDEIYGKVQDQDYWLYSFHPAVRNYIQGLINEKKQGYYNDDLEIKYGKKFSECYYNLINSTYDSIGKENHISSLARFNIISKGKDNDFENAIRLATDKQKGAIILNYMGLISGKINMYAKSIDYHKRSIDINKELDNRDGLGREYSNIGPELYYMGNYKEALDYLKKALEIQTELNYRIGIAVDYNNIGLELYYMGNYQQALDYHNKSLEIKKSLNDRAGIGSSHSNIGLVLRKMGNYQQALDYYNKALEIDKELNDRVNMGRDYTYIGNVLSDMGNYQQALDYHNKALNTHEEMKDTIGIARDLYYMSFVYMEANKNQDALDCLNKALVKLEEFKKETNYHHPLLDDVNNRISYLKGD